MNMMKRIALLCLILPVMASAQTARDFFLSAPVELVGYIDKSLRLDLLDYYDAGLGADRSVKTNRNVDACLLQFSDSTFTVKVGEVLTICGKILPAKSDTVIAMIETLATPATDSKLNIYNKEWQALPKAWAAPPDKAWGKHEATFLLTEYALEGDKLTLTDRTGEWNKDLAPQIKTLKYVWQPKSVKFKLLK